MNLQIASYASAASFLERCESFLSAEAAKNSLMLGVAYGAKDPQAPACPLLFSVQVEDKVVACAMQSDADKPVILAFTSEGNTDAVAKAMVTALPSRLPGMVGPLPGVRTLVEAWCKQHGQRVTTRFEQGIFELTNINYAGFQEIGILEPASEHHYVLICEWIAAFEREVFAHESFSAEQARAFADNALRDRSLYILHVDSIPRAMAAIARPTPTGASISYVYTPPAHRKRGYASTAVAKLAQHILSTGKERVWLYTDLANPTSNKIYQNIGFERQADSLYVAF